MGLPASCVDTNHQPTPYVAPNVANTFGTVLGSACFPSVNDAAWMMLNPDYDPVNHPSRPKYIPLAGALFGGEFQPDGKPDTYKDPKREYQAVEIEVNKGFSHNWALVANWRIARLRDRKSTRLNSSHGYISYAVFCLKKNKPCCRPCLRDTEHVAPEAAAAGYPCTIVRWHRDIVPRRQAARSMRGRPRRPATRRYIQS